MSSPSGMRDLNLSTMLENKGFDVVIVCTSNAAQATYWQQRLEKGKGTVVPPGSIVLAVDEDWEGGAGNALGTFYAYQKACRKALAEGKGDIHTDLQAGKISIGMYHTAGKGTRLAPLPGAENNNKPGVKLPALVTLGSETMLLTILESVVKQTGVYAPSRKGRLSVFWGDQIFIPSVKVEYTPRHHVDILCFLGPMPSKEKWERDGLNKYGLIAVNEQGDAAQVEKVTHSQAEDMLKSFGNVKDVGPSLGSFSVSSAILDQFLEEFAKELKAKKGKYDTDPHLWMPMTLDEDSYIQLMETKGVAKREAQQHHRRIKNMTTQFAAAGMTNGVTSPLKSEAKAKAGSGPQMGLFGAVDVGTDKYWWDYGQLKLYHTYVLRLRDSDSEAVAMRKFFNIAQTGRGELCRVGPTKLVGSSCISKSDILEGSIKESLLCGVTAPRVEADGAILVNVTATGKVVAPPGSILYNVVVDGDLVVKQDDVVAGVFDTAGKMTTMKSSTTIDGGKVWKAVVCDNPSSFEGVYLANTTTDVAAVEKASQKKHAELARQTSLTAAKVEQSSRKWRDLTLSGAIFAALLAAGYMAHQQGHI